MAPRKAKRGKSPLVAEALAFYFAAQDRRALALLYSEAAQDRQFQVDNNAVQKNFAALDHEAAAGSPRSHPWSARGV